MATVPVNINTISSVKKHRIILKNKDHTPSSLKQNQPESILIISNTPKYYTLFWGVEGA
jgi:hypothetical protein